MNQIINHVVVIKPSLKGHSGRNYGVVKRYNERYNSFIIEYPNHSVEKVYAELVIDTGLTSQGLEKILDLWWNTDPDVYEELHRKVGGIGAFMLVDLVDRDPALFSYLVEKK